MKYGKFVYSRSQVSGSSPLHDSRVLVVKAKPRCDLSRVESANAILVKVKEIHSCYSLLYSLYIFGIYIEISLEIH